ncbi:hypothetical protein AVEN_267849-1 [Araneus ventricosus]|uniref:Uncharacterized protein n=1 Tax=Araneus ventricosus TaxID=182803 RepID=A0A4Y2USN6_ARAVE|nr:hypothetical protein AVEN_267849-1 [Araneus ventricosus]
MRVTRSVIVSEVFNAHYLSSNSPKECTDAFAALQRSSSSQRLASIPRGLRTPLTSAEISSSERDSDFSIFSNHSISKIESRISRPYTLNPYDEPL